MKRDNALALIRSFIIFVFLLFIINKNHNKMSQMIILPFLLCSLFSIGKNIGLITNQKRIVVLFSQLFKICFLTFWFGFLIYLSINMIQNKNYYSFIFTIPFWIVGIYMILNLFGVNVKKQLKFNFQAVVSSFFVITVLSIGIICLFFGIRDYIKTKDYCTTEGYLIDYHIYDNDQDSTTYQLEYRYEVDGKEYTIMSDYGIDLKLIPEINSPKEIRYHANHPEEAILSGTNKSHFLIYFGAFFTLGGGVFGLAWLYLKGIFDKVKINVMAIYTSGVCIMIGIGIVLFLNDTVSSLTNTIKVMGIWILLPILLISSGIYLIVKNLFLKK